MNTTNHTSPSGEDAANGATVEPCIAPACHQWDGTDTCTCRALLLRAQKALPVLSTVLSTAGLAGASIADDLLADVNAALAANGAIGEREAFEAWAKGQYSTRYIGTYMERTADAYERTKLAEAAWFAWQARAALTAEKVAQAEPVAWRHKWTNDASNAWQYESSGPQTDKLRIGMPGILNPDSARAQWEPLYAAPQPSQPDKN